VQVVVQQLSVLGPFLWELRAGKLRLEAVKLRPEQELALALAPEQNLVLVLALALLLLLLLRRRLSVLLQPPLELMQAPKSE
jgi:hypothetical protein